jgi:hypothetical protein
MAATACSKAQALLVDEFEAHQQAAQEFPPSISPFIIRSAVKSFIQSLEDECNRRVCSSCGVFIPFINTNALEDEDERLTLLKTAGLDNCGRQGASWLFCKSCYSDILSNKVPKFSALNSVNVLMCDLYPDILKDLTLIEECVIARRHPVGCI